MKYKVKKKFIPQLLDIDFQTNEYFEKILKENNNHDIQEGKVVNGRIINITKNTIIIDIGVKNEGRIPIEEFNPSSSLQIGDTIDVYIEKLEGNNGRTILSREKAIREATWKQLEITYSKNQHVNGIIFSRVKGGFTVNLSGVIAFLPGSQVDVRPIKDISSLIGITQPFQILKMDTKLGNIVVSRRAIIEESRSEAREEMLSKIQIGTILEGIVKNLTNYGAFIDLGNIDALLHVTDISWSRINHPSEILGIGQKIKVIVIDYNQDTKKISLGMKQLDSNPWDNIKEEFPIGHIMTSKITNIADYGVFIELKNGIEGLVHSSELSWIKNNQNPKKILHIGQEVEFKILDIDTNKHRISLSIKQCQENPLITFSKQYPVGSIIKNVTIRNITDFAIFVELSENIDGMIHESDISWESSNKHELLTMFKKQDIIDCKVLTIDIEKERVGLGIKQLTIDPLQKEFELYKNKNIFCTITDIKDDELEVCYGDNKSLGFIKKTELSIDKSEQKINKFQINDIIEARVISIDKNLHKMMLSIKIIEIEERKRVIKEYSSIDITNNLEEILGEAMNNNKL